MDALYVVGKAAVEPRLTSSEKMGVDFIFKQIEALGNNAEDAFVALEAETDFVNALFGTHISTGSNPEIPPRLPFVADLERLNKQVEAIRGAIPKFTEDCASTAKLLNSKLQY